MRKPHLIPYLLSAALLGAIGVSAVQSQVVVGTQDFSITVDEANVPQGFDLPPITVYASGTAQTPPIPLTGFTGPLPISLSGTGSPEYSLNGGAFTSEPGVVNEGDTLVIRLTASATATQTQTATVTIGTLTDSLVVTASAHPSTTLLQLSNVYTNAPLSTLYSSREIDRFVTVPLANTPISISGGAEYRVGRAPGRPPRPSSRQGPVRFGSG